MDSLKRLAASAVVPVVVLDDAKDAVATARALLAGGVDVMEITFRTAAAADSIKAVAESCPDMLVGAGTVITLDQCRKAVECGAKFIVAPGFDEEVVRWCVENGVAVTPGCVTPTEIMAAMKLGLNVVKFFPAGVYGGLSAMKALSGPFGGIKFIPTGGVNTQNIGEFIAAPFIHAVGGSWVCPKADIAAGNFEKITELCKQARSAALGFEVAHIGVNCEDAAAASAVCEKLNEAFDLPVKDGSSSMFASSGIEVMKTMFKGKNGHIAIRTNSVELAAAELAAALLAAVEEDAPQPVSTPAHRASAAAAAVTRCQFCFFILYNTKDRSSVSIYPDNLKIEVLPVCRSICLKLNDNVAGLICRTSFLFKFYKKQLLYRNCGTLFVYL